MTTVQGAHPYPVHVEGRLDPGLSRWLWIVKWFLAIPHYVVLTFLWIAYFVLSVVAFFAILFTERYPRSIFEFNVGVLRWTWRVGYYAYGALATDRYPPFTLDDVADYPAHLEIEYPVRLSRGLVLIKWWLLAIPHYLIVGLLIGGLWFGWQSFHLAGGVITVLSVVAGIMLAATATYPEGLFDVILGLNRWVLRVQAYVGLMTDEYPPFRLDLGGSEPGDTLLVPTTAQPVEQPSVPATAPPTDRPVVQTVAAPVTFHRRWTAGRIVAVVFGAILVLPSLGLLAGGGTLLGFDLAGRDANGFINSGRHAFVTDTYALTTERIELPSNWVSGSALGNVRVRVTTTDPASRIFVGIGPTANVDAYLAGVPRATASDLWSKTISRNALGTAVPAEPSHQRFWASSIEGSGTAVLRWHAESGSWSIVVMRADAGRGIDVRASVGATIPGLRPVAIGLLAGGAVLFALSLALMIGASRRAR